MTDRDRELDEDLARRLRAQQGTGLEYGLARIAEALERIARALEAAGPSE
jgi:hypothetical protein